MDKELNNLLFARKILLGTIAEQKALADHFERLGQSGLPWITNVERLRKRIRQVQARLEAIGYE